MTGGNFDWNVQFPPFLNQYETQPVLTIYSRDKNDYGNYTIEVCVELENLYNWMEKDGLYRPLDTSSRKYDPDRPPDDLICTDCFNIYIYMNISDIHDGKVVEVFQDGFNTAPTAVITPKDIAIWAGDQLFVDYNDVFDAEGDNIVINIDLGRAVNFAKFDILTR